MDERRVLTVADEEKRRGRKRRAKRGLIAGYVHELSARHGAAGAEREQRQVAIANVRSG
jgi:hypothetical protein